MIKWYVENAPVRLKLLIAFGVTTGLTAIAALAPLVAGTGALAIGLTATVAAAVAGAAFRNGIAKPYVTTVMRMEGLAAGDLTSPIEFTDFTDCVGRMTRAMFTFRDTARAQIEINRTADINAETVRTMQGNMEALATGDLTAFILVDFPESYSALKTAFNAALENLRHMVQGVVNAEGIRTGTGEIAQASDDLARRTESNAASLEQTSAALAQIDGRIKSAAAASVDTVSRANQAPSVGERPSATCRCLRASANFLRRRSELLEIVDVLRSASIIEPRIRTVA